MRPTTQAAFTVLELLIVAVIVGILATASLVSWAKAIEQSKGRDAEATLKMIFEAEQEYAAHEGQDKYTASWSAVTPKYLPNCPDDDDWKYRLAGGEASFTAYAIRQGGPHRNQCRTITPSGVIPEPWPPTAGTVPCDAGTASPCS